MRSWLLLLALAGCNERALAPPAPESRVPDGSPDLSSSDLAHVCDPECCKLIGDLCALDSECCTAICGRDGRCVFDECAALDEPCQLPGDCCGGLVCSSDTSDFPLCVEPDPCGLGSCKSTGAACQRDCECCNLSCRGGVCAQPDRCGGDQCCPLGAPCSVSADCCGGLACVPVDGGLFRCGEADWCGGQCGTTGAACLTVCDCCSRQCVVADGGITGYCL